MSKFQVPSRPATSRVRACAPRVRRVAVRCRRTLVRPLIVARYLAADSPRHRPAVRSPGCLGARASGPVTARLQRGGARDRTSHATAVPICVLITYLLMQKKTTVTVRGRRVVRLCLIAHASLHRPVNTGRRPGRGYSVHTNFRFVPAVLSIEISLSLALKRQVRFYRVYHNRLFG